MVPSPSRPAPFSAFSLPPYDSPLLYSLLFIPSPSSHSGSCPAIARLHLHFLGALSSLRVAGPVGCAVPGAVAAEPFLVAAPFFPSSSRHVGHLIIIVIFFFIPLLVCPVFPSPFLSQVDFFFLSPFLRACP